MNAICKELTQFMSPNLLLNNLNTNNSKELLAFVLEHLPDAIYWIDKDWKIVYANEAASNMLGFTKDEFIGKCMFDISISTQQENLKEMWKDLEERKVVRLKSTHKSKDGKLIPIEMVSNYLMVQEIAYYFVIARDISVQTETEKKITTTAEYYRLLADNVVDVIWEFDYETREINYVSPSIYELLGYTQGEFIHLPLSVIFPENEGIVAIGKIEDRVTQFKHGLRERYVDVFQTTRKDGTSVLIEMHSRIYQSDSKSNIKITGVSSDIGELLKIEKELREKNESLISISASKDKFLSVISHDLRGPIHSFASLTDFISKEMWTLPFKELEEGLRKLNHSAVNISSLLENLLSWSRLQQGQVSVEPKLINLGVLLSEAANTMNDQATLKNIEFVFHQVDPNARIVADENMMQTVLRNLLSNAIKFSPKGSKIVLSCVNNLSKVILEVKDYGIGMDELQLQNLFSSVNKGNKKGTEGEPSSGLGLILVKEFVELNGGSIEVRSMKNEGSTFGVHFPLFIPNS